MFNSISILFQESSMTTRKTGSSADSPGLVMLFIDGLGVGLDDPELNPLASEDLHILSILQKSSQRVETSPSFSARTIDATMGVEGLPQSATGQTALLTGVNASSFLGRHLTGLPHSRLRGVIARESIFLKLARKGLVGNFANAFTPRLFEFLHKRRLSVTTWATLAGGRPLATLHDLAHHRAVYQDFTNLHLQMRDFDLPLWTPAHAGRVLAGLVTRQPFLLYEYFLTDIAGHSGDKEFVSLILSVLDSFLESFLATVDLSSTTVILTSDHGNIEDSLSRSHTRNSVTLLVWGPGAEYFTNRVTAIEELTPAMIDYLNTTPHSG